MNAGRRIPLYSALLLGLAGLPAAGQSTFEGSDDNGDGVISRSEWRGDNRSFRMHDTNRDRVLSGTELPREMRREMRRNARSTNRYGAADRAASRLDDNRNGRVEGYEWPYNSSLFHQLDRNGDSVLTTDELNNLSTATLSDLDQNRNGRVDSDEWPGTFATFDRLDANRDGRVSASEYFERGGEWQRSQRFDAWDVNRDGVLQANEWQSRRALFNRLDRNRDSVVTRDEFMGDTESYNQPYVWR